MFDSLLLSIPAAVNIYDNKTRLVFADGKNAKNSLMLISVLGCTEKFVSGT